MKPYQKDQLSITTTQLCVAGQVEKRVGLTFSNPPTLSSREALMNKASHLFHPATVLLGIALVAALSGCVGYVDDGYGGAEVIAPGPDVTIFGGGFERGRVVHGYSHRGFVSRGAAHGGFHGRR
jgi:hypothetical protein